MSYLAIRFTWGLLGVCLMAGEAASLVVMRGPLERVTRTMIHDMSVAFDILALLVWMLVFAVYWACRGNR